MAEFETLRAEQIDFKGGGEFLELSVNVVKDGTRATKYLRLARGYYDSKGEPRYKKGGVTLPADREALDKLAVAIQKLDLSEFAAQAGAEPDA